MTLEEHIKKHKKKLLYTAAALMIAGFGYLNHQSNKALMSHSIWYMENPYYQGYPFRFIKDTDGDNKPDVTWEYQLGPYGGFMHIRERKPDSLEIRYFNDNIKK